MHSLIASYFSLFFSDAFVLLTFFQVMPDILYPNGTEVIINIDQGNMLKPNCGIDKNGNGNFTLAVQAKSLGIFCFVNCLYVSFSLSPTSLTSHSVYVQASGSSPMAQEPLLMQ